MDSLKKYNFKDDHGHPLENCQDFIELVHRAESAESSLAAMRQRAEEAEATVAEAVECSRAQTKNFFDMKWRAERAESCLRRVQRLADDGVDDPAGPYNVLAQIANTAEVVLSSPPADASKMGGDHIGDATKMVGEREQKS